MKKFRANAQSYFSLLNQTGWFVNAKCELPPAFRKGKLSDAEYADAAILFAAGHGQPPGFWADCLSVEPEAQVGKYFGDQDHWEFNLPVVGLRWHQFPWDAHVGTSLAWGIGPSYATEVPPVELDTNDSSSRWLVYWFAEMTVGPPAAAWEMLLRLHHRSDSFGLVAEDGDCERLTT